MIHRFFPRTTMGFPKTKRFFFPQDGFFLRKQDKTKRFFSQNGFFLRKQDNDQPRFWQERIFFPQWWVFILNRLWHYPIVKLPNDSENYPIVTHPIVTVPDGDINRTVLEEKWITLTQDSFWRRLRGESSDGRLKNSSEINESLLRKFRRSRRIIIIFEKNESLLKMF